MAKTLIETPSTAEVARDLGVSDDRVRNAERMVFGDSASRRFGSRKIGRKAVKKTTARRRKAPPACG